MAKTLLKVDRNGTQHYVDYTCNRCGGAGSSDAWVYTGSVCYECGGTGKSKGSVTKVYTEEYSAKMKSKAEAKALKALEERKANATIINADTLVYAGFAEDGSAYVVLGNTYEIKDALKLKGARFNNLLGWFFSEEVEGYEAFKVNAKDLYAVDNAGCYTTMKVESEVLKEIESANNALKAFNDGISESKHIAEVGSKIKAVVTLKRVNSFQSTFYYNTTTTYIYNFTDTEGNVIVWKTSSYLGLEEGAVVELSGTVKEHTEYRGIKQTNVLRCKIK